MWYTSRIHKTLQWMFMLGLASLPVWSHADESNPQQSTELHVFKSPSCGCCGKWVDHLTAAGFKTQVENTDQMSMIKDDLGVPTHLRSCHTAKSGSYYFEGHIPSDVISRFMKEKPENAVGLSVAGMPAGSPGMEMGSRRDAYNVIQVNQDGSEVVYQLFDDRPVRENCRHSTTIKAICLFMLTVEGRLRLRDIPTYRL